MRNKEIHNVHDGLDCFVEKVENKSNTKLDNLIGRL